jgi:hypothetical protein
LKKGEEHLVYCVVDIPSSFRIYFKHWNKKRIRKKVYVKAIFNEEAKHIKEVSKLPLTKVRTIPKEFSTPAVINIYGNKVAIILWTKNPLAFIVKNKEYADSFRNYFELLWKISKP